MTGASSLARVVSRDSRLLRRGVRYGPGVIPERIGGVVFDCDGLLLDTEACWSRAEAALFAAYGFPFGLAEKDLLIGRTLEAACANMASYFGIPARERASSPELVPLVEAEPWPGRPVETDHRVGHRTGGH